MRGDGEIFDLATALGGAPDVLADDQPVDHQPAGHQPADGQADDQPVDGQADDQPAEYRGDGAPDAAAIESAQAGMTKADLLAFVSSAAGDGLVRHNIEGYDALVKNGLDEIIRTQFRMTRAWKNERPPTTEEDRRLGTGRPFGIKLLARRPVVRADVGAAHRRQGLIAGATRDDGQQRCQKNGGDFVHDGLPRRD